MTESETTIHGDTAPLGNKRAFFAARCDQRNDDIPSNVELLLAELERTGACARPSWHTAPQVPTLAATHHDPEGAQLQPERVMQALSRVLPHDAHVLADIGTAVFAAGHHLTLTPNQSLQLPLL